jgi:hypothetical protein
MEDTNLVDAAGNGIPRASTVDTRDTVTRDWRMRSIVLGALGSSATAITLSKADVATAIVVLVAALCALICVTLSMLWSRPFQVRIDHVGNEVRTLGVQIGFRHPEAAEDCHKTGRPSARVLPQADPAVEGC